MYSRIAPFSILMVEAVVPGLPCPLAPPGSRAWEALRGDGAGEEGRSRGISNSASPPWAIPPAAKISLQNPGFCEAHYASSFHWVTLVPSVSPLGALPPPPPPSLLPPLPPA